MTKLCLADIVRVQNNFRNHSNPKFWKKKVGPNFFSISKRNFVPIPMYLTVPPNCQNPDLNNVQEGPHRIGLNWFFSTSPSPSREIRINFPKIKKLKFLQLFSSKFLKNTKISSFFEKFSDFVNFGLKMKAVNFKTITTDDKALPGRYCARAK